MSNTIGTYNINDMTVVLGGIPLSGFYDDIITVEYDDDAIKEHEGCDGEVGRAINAKRLATATVTLIQTSATNDFLTGIFVAQRQTGATLPFVMMDASGTTVVEASNAWIKKVTKVEFGEEIKAREWVIKLAGCNIFAGGNHLAL